MESNKVELVTSKVMLGIQYPNDEILVSKLISGFDINPE